MTITHTCGHTSKVSPKEEWKQNSLCYECWKAKADADKEAAREAERKLAEVAAKENNLPELQGSEKQVAWALTIRDKWCSACKKIKLDKLTWGNVKDMEPKLFAGTFGNTKYQASPEAFAAMVSEFRGVLTQTSAKWWIDSREVLGGYTHIPVRIIGQTLLALHHDITYRV